MHIKPYEDAWLLSLILFFFFDFILYRKMRAVSHILNLLLLTDSVSDVIIQSTAMLVYYRQR